MCFRSLKTWKGLSTGLLSAHRPCFFSARPLWLFAGAQRESLRRCDRHPAAEGRQHVQRPQQQRLLQGATLRDEMCVVHSSCGSDGLAALYWIGLDWIALELRVPLCRRASHVDAELRFRLLLDTTVFSCSASSASVLRWCANDGTCVLLCTTRRRNHRRCSPCCGGFVYARNRACCLPANQTLCPPPQPLDLPFNNAGLYPPPRTLTREKTCSRCTRSS